MRENRFRGKDTETEEWLYGYLIGDDVIVGKIVDWDDEYFCTEFWRKVDPETVGQYTGLKDKNGIEIYKGDVWLYHGVGYHVCWHEDEAKFYFKHPSLHAGDDDHIDLGWSSHGEIIGDIIDNPELLEG